MAKDDFLPRVAGVTPGVTLKNIFDMFLALLSSPHSGGYSQQSLHFCTKFFLPRVAGVTQLKTLETDGFGIFFPALRGLLLLCFFRSKSVNNGFLPLLGGGLGYLLAKTLGIRLEFFSWGL